MRRRRKRRAPLLKYVALIGLAIFMCAPNRLELSAFTEYVSVLRVEPGQTVWQLASVVVDEDTDVRQVIQSILDENKLTKRSVPGSTRSSPASPRRRRQGGHVRQVLGAQLVPF